MNHSSGQELVLGCMSRPVTPPVHNTFSSFHDNTFHFVDMYLFGTTSVAFNAIRKSIVPMKKKGIGSTSVACCVAPRTVIPGLTLYPWPVVINSTDQIT